MRVGKLPVNNRIIDTLSRDQLRLIKRFKQMIKCSSDLKQAKGLTRRRKWLEVLGSEMNE